MLLIHVYTYKYILVSLLKGTSVLFFQRSMKFFSSKPHLHSCKGRCKTQVSGVMEWVHIKVHCPIGVKAVSLKILSTTNCQTCMEKGEVALAALLSNFAKLTKHLGSHIFGEFGEIAEIDIGCLNKFVTGSKRFVDFRESFRTILRSI